jgi:hypothetical protein
MSLSKMLFNVSWLFMSNRLSRLHDYIEPEMRRTRKHLQVKRYRIKTALYVWCGLATGSRAIIYSGRKFRRLMMMHRISDLILSKNPLIRFFMSTTISSSTYWHTYPTDSLLRQPRPHVAW